MGRDGCSRLMDAWRCYDLLGRASILTSKQPGFFLIPKSAQKTGRHDMEEAFACCDDRVIYGKEHVPLIGVAGECAIREPGSPSGVFGAATPIRPPPAERPESVEPCTEPGGRPIVGAPESARVVLHGVRLPEDPRTPSGDPLPPGGSSPTAEVARVSDSWHASGKVPSVVAALRAPPWTSSRFPSSTSRPCPRNVIHAR